LTVYTSTKNDGAEELCHRFANALAIRCLDAGYESHVSSDSPELCPFVWCSARSMVIPAMARRTNLHQGRSPRYNDSFGSSGHCVAAPFTKITCTVEIGFCIGERIRKKTARIQLF
jgi:hypothetical protein